MKKKYLSFLLVLILCFFTCFCNVDAIEKGQQYTRAFLLWDGRIVTSASNSQLQYKGVDGGGLSYESSKNNNEIKQWQIYTYYAQSNSAKHFMYCLDPNASGASKYVVERFLGDGTSDMHYDIGVMAIMHDGYDPAYNRSVDGLSEYNSQVATSLALRAWTIGLFGYGRGGNANDHDANYTNVVINQGIHWASHYYDKVDSFARKLASGSCESDNPDDTVKCLKNRVNSIYSFYKNSNASFLYVDSGTGKAVHEAAYKLFRTAIETTIDYENRLAAAKEETEQDGNSMPKVNVTNSTESVNKTQSYLKTKMDISKIPDGYSISNIKVECEKCSTYGITISAGEYFNGTDWIQFSTSDDLIPMAIKDGQEIQIRFLVTTPEAEDVCESVPYKVEYDLINKNSESGDNSKPGTEGNPIPGSEELEYAIPPEELTQYQYLLLKAKAGERKRTGEIIDPDSVQRFVFKVRISDSDSDDPNKIPHDPIPEEGDPPSGGIYDFSASSNVRKSFSSETGSIECYKESCSPIEHLPLCTYNRDDAVTNYKEEKDNKIKSCILYKEDVAGNSYRLSEDNDGLSEDNKYCQVFCKEDYANIQFTPIIKDVKCGGYFKLSAHVEGTKDCYTGGDKSDGYAIGGAQYKETIKKAQEQMIEGHDLYLKAAAAEKLLETTQETSKDYCKDKICTINCDVDNDGNPDINIDYDNDGVVDFNIDTDGDKKADIKIDADNNNECKDKCNPNEACDPENPAPGCCDSSKLVDSKCSSTGTPFDFTTKTKKAFVVSGTYNSVKAGTQSEEGIVPMVSVGSVSFSYGNAGTCVEDCELEFDRTGYINTCMSTSSETDEDKKTADCESKADTEEAKFRPSCDVTCNPEPSTKEQVKKMIEDDKTEALRLISSARETFDKAIVMYNSCTTGWKNNFKFAHDIYFDYAEEQYMNLLQEDQKKLVTVDGTESEESKIEICTGETNEQYECSTDVIELDQPGNVDLDQYGYNSSYEKAFDNVGFTVCDPKTGECNNSGVHVSKAKFIHIGVTKKADYITPTVFYQVENTSRITSQSTSSSPKVSLIPLENGLPISSKSTGTDWFKISLKGLGEYYDSHDGSLGRIFDSVVKAGDSVNTKSVGYKLFSEGITVDDGGNVVDPVKGWNTNYGIGQDGEYYCVFENACRDPGCPNCDPVCDPPTDIGIPECGWKECPECDVTCINCLFNLNELQLSFKSISTTNFNSANRAIGYNWDVNTTLSSLKLISSKASKTIEEITQMNETIYQDNQEGSSGSIDKDSSNASLGFSIRMTPEVTSYIRKYNEKIEAQDIGGYANDSLTCYDYDGFNGILCYSDFIDDLIKEYGDDGLITVRNRTEEGQRESNPNSDGYWTFWEDYKKPECALSDPSYPNCSTSVIGGPAWK